MSLINPQLASYVARSQNAIQSFINEEARIAVELLEGHTESDLTISTKGKFNVFPDHMIEFVWKGKIAIVFKPETTIQGIELVAYHMYDNNSRVTFAESQDI